MSNVEKNMWSQRHILLAMATFVVLMFIGAAVIAYGVMQSAEQTAREHMNILASHDMATIEDKVVTYMKDLGLISREAGNMYFDSVSELEDYLRVDTEAGYFHSFGILLDDGRLFADGHFIDGGPKYLPEFEAKDSFVWVHEGPIVEKDATERTLVVGSKFNNTRVGNQNAVGLLGVTDVTSFEEVMDRATFDVNSYSIVVNEEFKLVAGVHRAEALSGNANIFEHIKDRDYLQYDKVRNYMERMKTGETFMDEFVGPGGTYYYVVFQQAENIGWYYILFEPRSSYINMSNEYMRLIVLIMLMDLATVIVITVAILRNRKIQKVINDRTAFLANLCHEVKTPLNGIMGLNYLMKANIDDKEKLLSYIEKNQSSAEYMQRLVADAIELSRVQSDMYELEEADFRLSAEIENIRAMQLQTYVDKGIKLTVHQDIMDDVLYGDIQKIKQIIMNILTNAAKFTDEGGQVHMTISQSHKGGNTMTEFTISDTGCGIDKEFQKTIFESFTTDRDHSYDDFLKGAGLGLPISYSLAKLMGGTITVSSDLGKGSTFTVKLPLKKGHVQPSDYDLFRDISVEGDELSILIAEDDDLNAEILLEVFKEHEIKATRVTNGKEALELFESSAEGEYNVILMDVRMPVMSGYEASKAIRALDRADAYSVSIVACSANTSKEEMMLAKDAGMSNFVAKPINIELLLKMLGHQEHKNE